MGDVSLGTVKAKLEFDASEVQKGAEDISRALKLTQDQIIALANATEDQRVKMIAAFDAEAKGAEQATASVEKWTDAQQRAAASMNSVQDQANKLNAEFDRHASVVGNLTGRYEEYSANIAKTGVAMGIAAGAAAAFGAAVLGVAKQIFDAAAANAEYVENLDKMALKTGLSTSTLESLGKAAEESGVGMRTVTTAITRLQIAVATNNPALEKLGLSLRDLKAASPEEMLAQVVPKLAEVANAAERNALSMKLLGRTFGEARFALEAYLAAGDRFVNLTEDQKTASREMDAALDSAKTAWADLAKQFGAVATSPELIQTINDIGGAVRDLAKFIQENREAIGWFFGLLTAAVNPASIGAKAGDQLRSLGKAAAEMIGARPTEELPAVKSPDFKKAAIFQPEDPLATVGKQTAFLDELQKQATAKAEAASKVAEAEAKKLQGVMDGLSGAKAQEQVDLISAAVGKLGVEGVEDLAGLGKQLVDLASKGAKIPDALRPAIQAFAQQAAMKGVPQLAAKAWDEMTKTAESNIKKQASLKIADAKQQEDVLKQFGKTEVALGKESTDLIQAQLRTGTLSYKQEFEARKDAIRSANQEHINNLRKVEDATIAAASHAKDPALKAALESQVAEIEKQVAAWDHVTAAQIRAAEKLEKYAAIQRTLSGFSDVIAGIGDLFTMLGGKADSFFAKVLQGAQGAVQGISGMVSSFQSIGDSLAKGGISGILGAVTGGIGLVTSAIGVVKSIVGVFHKPEFKKIMNDVGKSWGVSISEGLAKEIEGIAKANKISRSLAELLDVSKIIGESGKDPREFTAKISDLMNAIKSGAVPAAQGLAELGRAFNQVADAALKSGNIGDKALVGLLKRARELGQVTPEMKEFVAGQLSSAVEGVQKLIEVMPPDTAAKAGSSGALLAATFNAIAAEQGILAASAALGPAYDQLMGQISKAGLAIPEALQSIGRQMELGRKPEFAAASQAAAATSQVLTGLGNAGYMDTAVLGASADVAKQTFDQAKNAGATDKEAYQLIGSLLSDIKNASIQSGQELSGVAQELISGANAEGVVIQGDQLSVLVDIRNILAGGGYEPGGTGGGAYGGASGTGGGFGGTGSETGGYTGRAADVYTAPPSATYQERELRHMEGFAGGSNGVRDFGPGTPVILHDREAVLTEKQLSDVGRPGMGSSVSFHPVFNNDPVQTNESRHELSSFQIDEFVRQVINNPLFKQILRDQGLRG